MIEIIWSLFIVDGGWSEWQKWQECVIKNGKCLRTRSRYCDNPVPAEGGDNCKGLNQEQRQCEAQICKGILCLIIRYIIRKRYLIFILFYNKNSSTYNTKQDLDNRNS